MGKIEIYKSEKERPDQTPMLGKPLTITEERCYRMIYLSGMEPISADEIAKELVFCFSNFKVTKTRVECNISRIRSKLGKNSIICITNEGYISRKALINDMVAKNKKNG